MAYQAAQAVPVDVGCSRLLGSLHQHRSLMYEKNRIEVLRPQLLTLIASCLTYEWPAHSTVATESPVPCPRPTFAAYMTQQLSFTLRFLLFPPKRFACE